MGEQGEATPGDGDGDQVHGEPSGHERYPPVEQEPCDAGGAEERDEVDEVVGAAGDRADARGAGTGPAVRARCWAW